MCRLEQRNLVGLREPVHDPGDPPEPHPGAVQTREHHQVLEVPSHTRRRELDVPFVGQSRVHDRPGTVFGPDALVQGHAMETWEQGGDFKARILGDARITDVLDKDEIDRAFSLDEALRHVDAIFERTLAESA